ncbi:(d)CMP kinase [Neomoorella thermoacetica]|uniref:(d)CMP kinase n=1 Tax=Neomoorella thermoacetica TaxID=1525 RepID=UPI0008FB58FE|nr:(d)CMP kinase [Moorella thermoacetica]APC08501.1 cytidylate kinase [Moorella thermoacetica]
MIEKMQGNIAIDGPAGAGKSTVARLLAARLGYLYIDTGAMYRALTWKALGLGIDLEDSRRLVELAEGTSIRLEDRGEGGIAVYCDGEEVTRAIRRSEVSRYVSIVAGVPGVRQCLVKLQRKMAASNRVVMDGRDIGTLVLPGAPYKFFLTASLAERARRRYQELLASGQQADLETIMEEIRQRDARDSQREVAPLKPAPDAIIIDTSQMSVEDVVARIMSLIAVAGQKG